MVTRLGDKLKYWTNPSVEQINLSGDPLADFIERTRQVIFDAMQKGWSGPPFDPFKLADILRLQVVPTENVLDARTVPAPSGKVRIEFNPNRPIARVRYSVAHEIAHTLFPDCRDYVRERQAKNLSRSDEWQLEMLCNVSAAEFLMPIGSFPDLREKPLNIEDMTNLREKYQVSTEALLLRSVKLTDLPCFVFCCSKRKSDDEYGRYEIDYAIPSKNFENRISSGTIIPKGSNVENCTAIGFTAKGEEIWPRASGKIHIECIGLPPYPGHRFPRVAGIGSPHNIGNIEPKKINYVKGDATEPRGEGSKIIAFVVNDKGQSWAGFALAIQKKWPIVLDDFQSWRNQKPNEFTLGSINTSRISTDLMTVTMVSQHGYGDSPTPRIRYSALETCLQRLANEAIKRNTTVHMPRIGSGQAGGSWWIIEELINDILVNKGIRVTVYDLPKSGKKKAQQLSFAL